MPENGRQLRSFKKCMATFSERYPDSVLANPGNYVYAYLSTDDRINTFFSLDDDSEGNGVLVIGGKEASKLLGIFDDLYRAQRSIFAATDGSPSKTSKS